MVQHLQSSTCPEHSTTKSGDQYMMNGLIAAASSLVDEQSPMFTYVPSTSQEKAQIQSQGTQPNVPPRKKKVSPGSSSHHQISHNIQDEEEGEETSALPYVRHSKRVRLHPNGQHIERELVESLPMSEVTSDRLLATKRIVNAFNAGDIEAIREIIYDCVIDVCEVYFSNINHAFIGRAALFSLWSSLFEAFPNGIFRTSDSVINEKKQVFTSFLFFGTKIFPLLIDGTPLEILSSQDAAPTGGPINSQSGPSTKTPAQEFTDHFLQSATVKVDRTQSIFTTAELIEAENVPEMVFEGRIVLHMNEQCKIRKFDFAWNRKL